MSVYLKDPGSKLDWQHDWSGWLASGETIATSQWTVEPAGLTLSAPMATASTTTVWVEGGTVGQVYRLVNRITTSAGRIEERTVVIRVEQT